MQPNDSGSGVTMPSNVSTKPADDLVFRDKPKNTGMIVGMVILVLLAAGGIGFGVWMYLSGSQKEIELNSEIDTLREQNDLLKEQIDGLDQRIEDLQNDEIVVENEVDKDEMDNGENGVDAETWSGQSANYPITGDDLTNDPSYKQLHDE